MRHKTQKAALIPLFFLFFVFVVVPGVPGSFLSTPTALAAVKAKKPTYNALPVAQAIPRVQLKAPVKIAQKKVKGAIVAPNVIPKKLEAHLKIPKIKVDAVIKDMGVTSEGAMAVPDNRVDVGWYGLGTRPGETGSAVVGGHNYWDNGAGVFEHLDQLKKGDVVTVVDAAGVSTSFMVQEMRTYDAMDENTGIFQSESGVHLNLITCSGVWNPATKSYTTRLVVFTDVIAEPSAVTSPPS